MDLRDKLLGGAAIAALSMGLITTEADAQSAAGTVVTQSSFRADAATFMTGNSRTSCGTTQDSVANLTLTMTPNAGNYVYLLGFYAEVGNNSTGAASTVTWSTTNLAGNPAWETTGQAAAAVGAQQVAESYPTGYRSLTPGTAVTITPSATMASAYQCVKALWYQNPS
jgi:hypothetical protein